MMSASGAKAAGGLPPPASSKRPAAGVDMDWDDEDEKTTVYDKAGGEDPARALLEASVPPPPAPPPQMSAPPVMRAPAQPTRPTNRPPPPPAPIPLPMPAPVVPQIAAMPHAAPFARERSRSGLFLGVVVLLAAAALLFVFWPRTGSLVVTVSGPGNKPLDAVEILMNGDKKCASSPCTIEGLKPDTYYVRAHAAGYQPMADIAVVVSSGNKAVQNLTLVRATGTGIKVIGEGTGLKLYVDGREVGPLPQEIKDMEPGEHVVRVAGSDRFEPFEKRITVEPEQMQTIGPLKLRVVKGLATIQPGPGADGARVILISGTDRRTLPKLPITLDIPTAQLHTLVATKRGYESFKLPIKFDDGQVEKTFEIAMTETGAVAPPPDKGSAPSTHRGGGGGVTVGGGGGGVPPQQETQPTAAGGTATLNINSIPVSNIILDGRPVGATPKVGQKVSAGTHSILFVNGSDRKQASVTVGAGQTKTVAVRF
jgi:serine/threonine-protein kinase